MTNCLRYDLLLQVFKATDTQTGDIVAIKQMSLSGITSDNLQAIVGEIDLLKNLRHKNIVKYIGSFKTRTHLSIILEYMEKGSLADVIRPAKFGAFPESLAAVYIAQVRTFTHMRSQLISRPCCWQALLAI